jgi:nucleotide-binding universal stress UspA family protein
MTENRATRIVVGVEDSDRSKDAVALAAQLARAAGATVVLANAFPLDPVPSRTSTPALRRRLEEQSYELLERHAQAAGEGVRTELEALPGFSPAHLLHDLAQRANAALIVIGSSHRGGVGRVFAGTTAERLLHGSPCPVAVAPSGYAERAHGPIRSIVAGYDGADEAKAALDMAIAAAGALPAALRIVRVLQRSYLALMASPGYGVPAVDIETEVREGFEAEMAAMPEIARAETAFVVGDPVEELAERSAAADLVVVGSRGYGPHAAVLLGSVSGRLVREAECPVMVVPRGAAPHAAELFPATQSTGASS